MIWLITYDSWRIICMCCGGGLLQYELCECWHLRMFAWLVSQEDASAALDNISQFLSYYELHGIPLHWWPHPDYVDTVDAIQSQTPTAPLLSYTFLLVIYMISYHSWDGPYPVAYTQPMPHGLLLVIGYDMICSPSTCTIYYIHVIVDCNCIISTTHIFEVRKF